MDVFKKNFIENRRKRCETLFGIAEEYERESFMLEKIDNDSFEALTFALILPDVAFSKEFEEHVIPEIKKIFKILGEECERMCPEDWKKTKNVMLRMIDKTE